MERSFWRKEGQRKVMVAPCHKLYRQNRTLSEDLRLFPFSLMITTLLYVCLYTLDASLKGGVACELRTLISIVKVNYDRGVPVSGQLLIIA